MGRGKYLKMSKNNKVDFESLIDESLSNIRNDRAMASTLLIDLMKHIGSNKHEHKESGQIAAKYLETLQRSNEQMVKLATLLSKKEGVSTGLSSLEKSDIYDLIKDD